MAPPAPRSISAMYARTTSRTSERSRRGARLPARMTGGSAPRSISAIWRAKLGAANAGVWRGPVWLKARATITSSPSSTAARRVRISCASLLSA